MYDVIVLGASFAAAGIARICGKRCLVLERRMEAGYEFYGALHFETNYERELSLKEAEEMRSHFFKNDSPYGNDALLYPIFKECDIFFGMELVSVEAKDEGFLCTVHGVDGFRSFEGKTVVDTRCNAKNSTSKSYNLLIESKELPRFEGVSCKQADTAGRFVLEIPVSLSSSFHEAREIALEIIKTFPPSQKLILSASEFDYQISKSIQREDGIRALPSKAYENPLLAYEAGLIFGKELKK